MGATVQADAKPGLPEKSGNVQTAAMRIMAGQWGSVQQDALNCAVKKQILQ
jgi:hypothetical protein